MEFFMGAGAPGEFGGLLDRFYTMGFHGCRFDVTNTQYFIENIAELSERVVQKPEAKHIYIVNGDTEEEVIARADLVISRVKGLGLQKNVIIEVLNEPTLNDNWKKKPNAVGRLSKKVWNMTKSDGTQVLAGSLHTITKDIFEYGSKVLEECPLDIGFSYHRYSSPDLTKAINKDISKEKEVEMVKNLGAGRVIYCTETGQSETQGRKKKFPRCLFGKETYWLSEDEIARQTVEETKYWVNTGILTGIGFYQINDGKDKYNREDRFGWRHFEEAWDGPWKVVAQIMPDVLNELN